MAANWMGIFQAIYRCRAETVMADAFRRAVGLPTKPRRRDQALPYRKSTYADVDFERLMTERYGVRM